MTSHSSGRNAEDAWRCAALTRTAAKRKVSGVSLPCRHVIVFHARADSSVANAEAAMGRCSLVVRQALGRSSKLGHPISIHTLLCGHQLGVTQPIANRLGSLRDAGRLDTTVDQ